MPLYTYQCSSCGDFDKRGGYDDSVLNCECGATAKRRPYSGGVGMIVDGRYLPTTPEEKQDHDFKELRKSGWDRDRALTGIRKNIATDKEGHRHFDASKMVDA